MLGWFRDQDFGPQPWSARGREYASFLRWRTDASGLWLVPLIAIFAVPYGLYGLVVGPPYDRSGCIQGVIAGVAVGWLGLKLLDARIARNKRERAEGSAADSGRWRWESRGEILAVLIIAILILIVGTVGESMDDDGPDMPAAVLWFVGLGSLLILPPLRALRRWDKQHPRSS